MTADAVAKAEARSKQGDSPSRGVFLDNIPNAFTSVTVTCGFVLMMSTSLPGVSPALCVFAVVLGLITDILDGVIARRLKVNSKFGATFDQLADLTCFGVGPGVFYARQHLMAVESWVPERPGVTMQQLVVIITGLLYVLCSVIRISRALVLSPGERPTYFVGIPTNLASAIMVPIVAFFPGFPLLPPLVVVLSALMVSSLHIPKGMWIIDVK